MQTYSDAEGEQLENTLDGEENGEDGVEPAQCVLVVFRLVVELNVNNNKTHINKLASVTPLWNTLRWRTIDCDDNDA